MAKNEVNNPQKCLESLQNAEKAFHRASHLTSQLLTFAKGGDPIKQTLDLRELVQDSVSFDLSGSSTRLRLEADPDLWRTNVDKGQISHVFSNLAINAKQAMPRGGTLSITLKNIDVAEDDIPGLDPGRYIRSTVTDEGLGIREEDLSQIFDPYFSTKQTGSGLGLATTYSIIHKHNGLIFVSSELGKGTSFVFFLPAAEKTTSWVMQEEPVEEGIAQGKRVLIMDDEEMICEFAEKMLEHAGFEVESSSNGIEAIQLYRDRQEEGRPFDCTIVDLTIPGGTGGEDVVREILALNPAAKVIVSSGYAEDPIMANFEKFGFSGVIRKPFSMETLRDTVERVVSLEDQE